MVPADELVRRLCVSWRARHADACGTAAVLDRLRQCCIHLAPQRVGAQERRLGRHAGCEEREFVATDAPEDPAFGLRALRQRRDGRIQRPVAFVVTVRRVELVQAVEVKEQKAHRIALLPRLLPLLHVDRAELRRAKASVHPHL